MKLLSFAAAAILIVAGLAFLVGGGAPSLMVSFGSPAVPMARAGDPVWIGIAFARSLGAALVALGLVALKASRLPSDAAKAITGPLMWGLALVSLVTLAQAQAIWGTSAGWTLAGMVSAAFAVSVVLNVARRQAKM